MTHLNLPISVRGGLTPLLICILYFTLSMNNCIILLLHDLCSLFPQFSCGETGKLRARLTQAQRVHACTTEYMSAPLSFARVAHFTQILPEFANYLAGVVRRAC